MAQADKFIDYYQLLCVSFDTTKDKIKKAYRNLALKKHPDKNPDNPNAATEFALLVEAKEILTDKESRIKYDKEYKIYKQQLEQREQEQIKNLQRSHARNEGINKLEQAEAKFKNKHRTNFYKNYIHKVKKSSIEEELNRFRQEIQREKQKEWMEQKNTRKILRENEKLKKKSLIVKLDQKKCNKPYSKSQLESIFKYYGKINDIIMNNNDKYIGAEIIFAKSKYVIKALNDEHTLKNDFYLTLIVYDKNKKDKIKKINEGDKWREMMKQRQNLSHQQYQQIVWNKIEHFIEKHSDTQTMDVD